MKQENSGKTSVNLDYKQSNQTSFIVQGEKIAIIKLVHFLISVAIFYLFWLLFRYKGLHVEHVRGFRYNYFVTFVFGVLLYLFNRTRSEEHTSELSSHNVASRMPSSA